MSYLKIAFGVLVVLSASRFIPHPPNFTSLLALSFYIPAIFGRKYIPAIIISLIFTDLIIGIHITMLFTITSIALIGLISNYFKKSILARIFGASTGAVIFFILSNFGVWLGGSYEYSLSGLYICYILAIPFFVNTIISTLVYSVLIESIVFLSKYFKINISRN